MIREGGGGSLMEIVFITNTGMLLPLLPLLLTQQNQLQTLVTTVNLPDTSSLVISRFSVLLNICLHQLLPGCYWSPVLLTLPAPVVKQLEQCVRYLHWKGWK